MSDDGKIKVTTGDISGSTMTIGHGNTVNSHNTNTQINIQAELSGLLSELKSIDAMDDSKIANEADYIEAEVVKDNPDKATVGMSLTRIVKRLADTNKLAAEAEKLLPRIQAIAEWAGPHGQEILDALPI